MLVDKIRQSARMCSVCGSAGYNIKVVVFDSKINTEFQRWIPQIVFGKLKSTDEASLWLEPKWGCTEGVRGVSSQKPPSGVSAWCCSPWPIVSLDYWIIREGNMSTQRKCLSSVLVCVTEVLIAESCLHDICRNIVTEGKMENYSRVWDKLMWLSLTQNDNKSFC